MYPIGSIYISTTLSSASAVSNALGGTWERFGRGRTLVGYTSTDADFNASEKTGGEKTHTLTIDEMPSHNHREQTSDDSTGGWYPTLKHSGWGQNNNMYTLNDFTESTGGSQAHNNLQPYITVYMYKRTA